jgi:hypothetical protein
VVGIADTVWGEYNWVVYEKIKYDSIVELLNTYRGDNVWSDVVYDLPGFDAFATGEESEVIVFKDGTRIAWDEKDKLWKVEG